MSAPAGPAGPAPPPAPPVTLQRLEVHDLRLFAAAHLEPAADGATVLTGPNGSGKTTLLEAVAYLGTQRSFRTASREAMVRTGAARAVVRATLAIDRPMLVESELDASGAARTLVNRQVARTRTDLAEAVPVTVFSPTDLALVQGPPARRRELLDGALRLLARRAGADLDETERVLRQRAALLRQAGGRLRPEIAATLDVWDDRLARAGEAVAAARAALLEALGPAAAAAYGDLAAPTRPEVVLGYRRSWEGDLASALAASRSDDVRRGVSTVGPHRDDLTVTLAGRDARLHASQGEQRSLALALRLAVHRLVAAQRGAPVLLLDDVFSELDPARSRALVETLPAGQTLCTTAMVLPAAFPVAMVVDVRDLATGEPASPPAR